MMEENYYQGTPENSAIDGPLPTLQDTLLQSRQDFPLPYLNLMDTTGGFQELLQTHPTQIRKTPPQQQTPMTDRQSNLIRQPNTSRYAPYWKPTAMIPGNIHTPEVSPFQAALAGLGSFQLNTHPPQPLTRNYEREIWELNQENKRLNNEIRFAMGRWTNECEKLFEQKRITTELANANIELTQKLRACETTIASKTITGSRQGNHPGIAKN